MGKLIFDPLTGDPTILATNRVKRVDQTGVVKTSSKKEKDNVDRFAKGNESLTPPTVYQDCEDWNVRVFSNKYPLLDDHEIIVHSPYIDKDIEDLPNEHNEKIIRAFLNRVAYYASQDKEVIIFNNRGGRAGASIVHPHSQLVASKGFPGVLEKEKAEALRYYNETGVSFWENEIKEELEYKERVVIDSAHFLLYVPRASRWSYEMRLVPKKQRADFGKIEEPEIIDLAKVLKQALTAYNVLFDRPDRNFWIHTSMHEPFHWHIGFLAHIKVFGALEIGCGIWVSDKASSEDAAQQLRSTIN